jgi:hypothetical protein
MTITTTAQIPARFLIIGDVVNTLPVPMQVKGIDATGARVLVSLRPLDGTAGRVEEYACFDLVELTDTVIL